MANFHQPGKIKKDGISDVEIIGHIIVPSFVSSIKTVPSIGMNSSLFIVLSCSYFES